MNEPTDIPLSRVLIPTAVFATGLDNATTGKNDHVMLLGFRRDDVDEDGVWVVLSEPQAALLVGEILSVVERHGDTATFLEKAFKRRDHIAANRAYRPATVRHATVPSEETEADEPRQG